MSQRVKIHLSNDQIVEVLNDRAMTFTLRELKDFLNGVEVNESYVEGQYGPEVEIPLGLLFRYVKFTSVTADKESK